VNNDLFEYQGYYGSVQYSKEDDCLYGRIEFIDDLVLYDGKSLPELRAAFEHAVDDYLEQCRLNGQEPNVTCKGSFNVRLGSELHRRAAVAAKQAQQTLNEFVKDAVVQKLGYS